MKKILLFVTLIFNNSVSAQEYTGYVFNKKTGKPIEYVNIGIVGGNAGTVSDEKGKYSLTLDHQLSKEYLRVSCIGFHPFQIPVSDFRRQFKYDIYLEERVFELSEVIIRPTKVKQRILGVTTKSKTIRAGFKENQLGYECGIFIRMRKKAYLEKVRINIAECSYDSIFYRLNIYRVMDKMNFENILRKPIYISLPKEQLDNTVIINVHQYNVVADGDFLVTLEHVRDLGPGSLMFCSGFPGKTYARKTSQGEWETVPVGVSISVEAKVED